MNFLEFMIGVKGSLKKVIFQVKVVVFYLLNGLYMFFLGLIGFGKFFFVNWIY